MSSPRGPVRRIGNRRLATLNAEHFDAINAEDFDEVKGSKFKAAENDPYLNLVNPISEKVEIWVLTF